METYIFLIVSSSSLLQEHISLISHTLGMKIITSALEGDASQSMGLPCDEEEGEALDSPVKKGRGTRARGSLTSAPDQHAVTSSRLAARRPTQLWSPFKEGTEGQRARG
jgi:hypothetical protein